MVEERTHNIFQIIGSAEENLRKLMQRTVEAYPIEWIIVHEALQNARDAIQAGPLDEGNIEIILDLDSNIITVKDDGKGFPHNITLLGIGGTDKEIDDWTIQGKQGVGLKALLLSTNTFNIESIVDGKKWEISCVGACNFSTGGQAEIIEKDPIDVDAPNGTIVSYGFNDDRILHFLNTLYSYSKKVSFYHAENPIDKFNLAIEWYFRRKTYAGDVNRIQNFPVIKKMNIKIIVKVGEEIPVFFVPELNAIFTASPTIEISFENKHWDIQESLDRMIPHIPKPSIINLDIPQSGRFTGLNPTMIWVKTFKDEEGYLTLLNNPGNVPPQDPTKYEGFFDRINGISIYVGQLTRMRNLLLEDPSQFVVANGVPSSHIIPLPSRGGSANYNRTVHFIINVNANLNYGKQNITDTYLLHMIHEFYTDAYRGTLKNISKAIVGIEVDDEGAGGYADFLEEGEKDVLIRADIGLPYLSIKKVPHDENTVIALFYELIGLDKIRGFDTYSISSFARYDAKVMIQTSQMKEIPIPKEDKHIPNVEFKQKISALISDFEDDRKIAKDIHLVIAWENDYEDTNPNYQIVNIEYTPDHDKVFPNVTQSIREKNTGWHIQMLILHELVDKLKTEL